MSQVVFRTTNSNWTVPAGVTEVLIASSDTSSVQKSNARLISVVPNTTYTVTINSSTYAINNSNTFGSLFTWTGSGYITLFWMD